MLRLAAIVLACACTVFSQISYSPKPAYRQRSEIEYSIDPFPSFADWWSNVTNEIGSIKYEYPSKTNEISSGKDHNNHTTSSRPPQDSSYSEEDDNAQSTQNSDTNQPEQLSDSPESYSSSQSSQSEPQGSDENIPTPANPVSPQYAPKYQEAQEPKNLNLQGTSYSNYNSFSDNYHQSLYPTQQDYTTKTPGSYYNKQHNIHGLWQAPPFYQSLKDFDDVTDIVKSQLNDNSSLGQTENQAHYTTIMGVLYGLIHTMSHSTWQYYDQMYNRNVPGFFKYSQFASNKIRAQVTCFNRLASKSISKLRKIMDNKWIKYICQVTKVPCDVLILATVDFVDNSELKQEARILLALGKSSGLFLNKYAKTLDAETKVNDNSPSNLYMFLMSAKDYFRPLVQAGTETLKLLPSSIYCPDIYS